MLSSSINSSDKIVEYVNQLKKYGTKILPPDINYSKYDFATLGNDVLFGFASIKGLGNETISKILNLREKVGKYNDIIHCIGFLSTNGIGIKIVETMIKAGCMDSLLGDKTRKYFITNLKEIFEKSKMLLSTGEMLLKPRMVDVAYDNSDKQRENDEQKELLNISFEQHPIEIIKKQFTFDKKIEDFMSINKSNYIFYNVAKLVSYKIIKTKTGINMAMGKFEDETQIVTLAIFSGVYEKNKDLLQNNKTYLICVKTSDRGGQLLSIKAI
ncbi:hypothetical protein FACS189459_3240 [Bacilli bacterium]|nr:hypothetical protein FACS189459_3240 [Bacilli bacterium]